jgi:bacillopeptidase F
VGRAPRSASACAAALAGLLAAPAAAGEIAPALAARLAGLAAGDEVAVIVVVRGGQRLPDPARGDRAVRRARLVRALRARAAPERALLRAWLAARGVERTTPLWIAGALAARVPARLVPALARLPAVERVALDALVQEPAPDAALAAAPPEWNLATLHVPEAWASGATGAGAVVAALDSGADPLHPDLAGRFRGGPGDWFDPYGEHAAPHDASGHGTEALSVAVGGASGGTAIGVAPDALWIAARVFDDSGAGTLSAIHLAFQWALDPDGDPDSDDAPDVVNHSWGLADSIDSCDPELAPDVAALRAAEIAVVFAAGNFGPAPHTSVAPANDPGSLAVGASDLANEPAPFSGRGPSPCGGPPYPRFLAPGVGIRAATLTFGGLFPDSYVVRSGTSLAAPHASGLLALLRGAHPQASLAALEAALVDGAVDLGATGPDDDTGFGLLDAAAALGALADGDGDGVVGSDDLCPQHPGTPELWGCPPPGCGIGGELVFALALLRLRRRRAAVRARNALGVAALLLLAALLAGAPGARAAGPDTHLAAAGLRLYREGVLPTGAPLEATALGDAPLRGAAAACAACHGRSGLGYPEGDRVPLPITAPALRAPRLLERRELYASRSTGPGTRPAYDDAALARALREGRDPAGRALDPLMPRYRLDDGALRALSAYLATLGAAPAPGVGDDVLHLATVVAGPVAPARKRALVAVLSAFVADKNAATRREAQRARYRAFHEEWKFRAWRRWELHVWELSGPPERWRAQLEAHERAQPAFALVSGIAAGPWRPIHRFCEERALPCVLPNTELPETTPPGFYTLYFSEGVALEAKVLARHLAAEGLAGGRIVQVHRARGPGAVAAGALRAALPEARLEEHALRGAPAPDDWRRLAATRADVAVLWLPGEDLAGAEPLAAARAPALYLSATLAGGCPAALPRALWPRSRCIHPLALPDGAARARPVEAWLRARGVEVPVDALVLDTHFAVRALGEALEHLGQHFSREYLIERLEHRLAGNVTPSAHPRLALGAGQRFASKGAWIVRPSESGSLEPVTPWIVP